VIAAHLAGDVAAVRGEARPERGDGVRAVAGDPGRTARDVEGAALGKSGRREVGSEGVVLGKGLREGRVEGSPARRTASGVKPNSARKARVKASCEP
jgi:hypothetical protein